MYGFSILTVFTLCSVVCGCLCFHINISFIPNTQEYSEDSNSEPNVDLENQYYNSKALKEDDPKAALSSFQKVRIFYWLLPTKLFFFFFRCLRSNKFQVILSQKSVLDTEWVIL